MFQTSAAPDAGHLVRRDLLAVAGAAEHDTQRLDPRRLIAHDRLGGADAERRVVVDGVVLQRPVVDDVVTGFGEVVLQARRELEAGVIRGDVDAHDAHPREARTRPALTGRCRRLPA